MQILAYHEALQYLRDVGPGKHIISISDAESTFKFPDDRRHKILFLYFDDLNDKHWNDEEIRHDHTFCLPTHIFMVDRFLREVKSIDMIHCFAGISRSTAIAYLVYRLQGVDRDRALQFIVGQVPQADPNPRIMRLAEEYIQTLKDEGRYEQ